MIYEILRIIVVYNNCIYSEVWPPNHEFVQQVKRRTPRFADVSDFGLLSDQSRFMSLWCPSQFHTLMTVSFFMTWQPYSIYKYTMITKITTRKPYDICNTFGDEIQSKRKQFVYSELCHKRWRSAFTYTQIEIFAPWKFHKVDTNCHCKISCFNRAHLNSNPKQMSCAYLSFGICVSA